MDHAAAQIIRRYVLATVAVTITALAPHSYAQNKKITYYYTDPQGTALATADEQGNIINNTDRDPYGEQVMGTPDPGPGFTGHVDDTDSGLVYMQARYYDPSLGRFLSIDPDPVVAGDIMGFNRYAYVSDNPANRVDPNGRRSVYEAGGGNPDYPLPWERDNDGPKSSRAVDPCAFCVAKGKDKKKTTNSALTYSQIANIVKNNNKSGQSDELVIAVIWKESGFNPSAKAGESSATGLMQMTKMAAKQVNFNHSEMLNPVTNVQAGTAYMSYWINRAHGDVRTGLNGFGTGAGYADNIIEAADALRLHPEDNREILSNIHP